MINKFKKKKKKNRNININKINWVGWSMEYGWKGRRRMMKSEVCFKGEVEKEMNE